MIFSTLFTQEAYICSFEDDNSLYSIEENYFKVF